MSDPPPRFRPGDRVVLRSTGEVGLVVCTWWDEHGWWDCYVAFVGTSWPPEREPPAERPYLLRYMAASLEALG